MKLTGILVKKVLKKANWEMSEVDLFELNEAFSVQALGVMKELGRIRLQGVE